MCRQMSSAPAKQGGHRRPGNPGKIPSFLKVLPAAQGRSDPQKSGKFSRPPGAFLKVLPAARGLFEGSPGRPGPLRPPKIREVAPPKTA